MTSGGTPSEIAPPGPWRSWVARAIRGVFLVQVAGQAAMLGAMVLLARVAGDAAFSDYVYVLAWVNLAVLVSKFGLDTSVLRFVASYAQTQQWGHLRGLWRWANGTVFGVGAAVAVLGVACSWALSRDPGLRWTAIWAAPLVPLLGLAALRSSALQAVHHYVRASVPELVLRPVLFAAVVWVAARILGGPIDAPRAMQLYGLSVAVAFVVGAWWWSRLRPAESRHAASTYDRRRWLGAGGSLLLVSGSHTLINQTDVVMLGAIVGEPDAGYYYVATRLSQFVGFGLVVVQAVAAPMISRLHAARDLPRLQRVLRWSAWGAVAFAGVVAAGLLGAGEVLLQIFGPSFIRARTAMLILAGAQVLSAATGLTGIAMSMTGRHGPAAVIVGVAALLNLGLNAVLIPRLGLEGAAIATALTTVAWNVVAVIYLHRTAGILTLAVPWRTRTGSEP